MKAKLQSFLRHSELGCQLSLNMQTPIYQNTLRLHSEKLDKLVAQLDQEFPWQPIHPKEPIESIMYRAGQDSVVRRLKTLLDEENNVSI